MSILYRFKKHCQHVQSIFKNPYFFQIENICIEFYVIKTKHLFNKNVSFAKKIRLIYSVSIHSFITEGMPDTTDFHIVVHIGTFYMQAIRKFNWK